MGPMMSPEEWRQVEELYHAALERPADRRSEFIAEACRGNTKLRIELESLLAQHSVVGSPLDRPAWENHPPAPLTGTIISRYEILEPLGAGGMGVVYKAKDTRLHRMVALKFLTEAHTREPEALKRFEREARAASALNHPNICTVYDVGEHDNRPFLILELLEGETLQERVRRGPLDVGELLDFGIQLCDSLDSAHQKGIIHRDIKPANIFLTTRGQAKILDFGVAKLHASPDALTATNSGSILGTSAYMSPEQARGEELDARTDLFSLGAVLYEMATARPAFPGNTVPMVFDALLHHNPAPASELAPRLPARLSEIVARALEKNRERRYLNALALMTDLKNLKQKLQPSPCPPEQAPLPVYPRFTDSILVLPFENAAGDASVDYLAEGIAEGIINRLAKLATLRVIARATAFRYKRAGIDPIQAGRELGVRLALAGRLKERAGRLAIGTELIDCADGSQLWGEKYDRGLNDLLTTEAEIAQEIANKLRIRLGFAEKEPLAEVSSGNPETHKLFLKAMYYANRWTPDGVQKSLEFLRQAIETDPAYPKAYTGLGYIYTLVGFFGMASPRDAFPKAKSAALKALEIEEDNASAHLLLGIIALFFDWDWHEAEKQLRTALRLAPNYANCHWGFGYYLLASGRCEDAIAEMKQAAALDPLSAPINYGLGAAYHFAGQSEAALKTYKDTVELDPAFIPAYQMIAGIYAQKGAHQDAFALLDRFKTQYPFGARDLIARAMVYAASGRVQEARQALSELYEGNAPRYIVAPGAAAAHAILGEHEQALDLLEESYQERVSAVMIIASHPSFASLHGHPRFANLLRRIGFPGAASTKTTA